MTKSKNYLTYNKPPKLLILEYPYTSIKTSHKIKIEVNNTTTLLYLKGIVYYGEIILPLELFPKMAKYGSMMELQMEVKVLRKAIFLQCQTKTLEKVKVKIWY